MAEAAKKETPRDVQITSGRMKLATEATSKASGDQRSSGPSKCGGGVTLRFSARSERRSMRGGKLSVQVVGAYCRARKQVIAFLW